MSRGSAASRRRRLRARVCHTAARRHWRRGISTTFTDFMHTDSPQLLLLLMDLNDNAVVTSFGRVGGGKRRKGRDVHSMGCWLMHYERVVVCCAYRVPFDASSPPDGVELLKTRYFGPSDLKTDDSRSLGESSAVQVYPAGRSFVRVTVICETINSNKIFI